MVDAKQKRPGMPGKSGPGQRSSSGLTRPGDLYLPGDALPVPDVVEKNTDSVWALWSDMVEGVSEPAPPGDKDFKATVPMDFDAMDKTQLMDLPDLDDDSKRGSR